MINRTVLVGRLTKDVELKYTQSGIAVSRFTLAVNRPFKNQNGENEADFINCVAWRKQAENMANFLRKGSLIGLEGRIQTSSFDGKDGNRVFMTEVVADSVQFLEPRSKSDNQTNAFGNNNAFNNGNAFSNQGNTTNNHAFPPQNNSYNNQAQNAPFEVVDDDLPF